MKGILKKTEEGWFVIFDQRTMQDPSAEDGMLPLHPEYQCILPLDLDLNGKEVEFGINMYDGKSHISNAWNGYAKLVDHIGDVNQMVDNLQTVSTKQLNQRVQKLIDKDIFDQAILAMEEMYGSGCDAEIDAYFRGAKWMQQKLINDNNAPHK